MSTNSTAKSARRAAELRAAKKVSGELCAALRATLSPEQAELFGQLEDALTATAVAEEHLNFAEICRHIGPAVAPVLDDLWQHVAQATGETTDYVVGACCDGVPRAS